VNPALAHLQATAAEAASTLGRMEESKTGDFGPGIVAFGIVALLAVATGLLMWSMVRQIRKVPADLNTPTGRRPRPARAPEADEPVEE
jgi:hypothetical protein